MYKHPKCKICGLNTHYTYACYKKPKKPIVFRKIKPLSATLGSKTVKVSSAKKNEQSNRKKLIKELDKYTSLICRLGASDKFGFATCYCCGVRIPWISGDCAHYCKRSYMRTRWLQENVRFNCVKCNRYLNGNYSAYEAHLKRELGEDEVLKLWDKAYDKRKIPTYELEEILVGVKQDYKDLINARKQKGWKC